LLFGTATCESLVWGTLLVSLICLEAPDFLNVKVHQRHAISEDTWRQVLEFSRSVHEDLSNYDPEGSSLSWEISVLSGLTILQENLHGSGVVLVCDFAHRIAACDHGQDYMTMHYIAFK